MFLSRCDRMPQRSRKGSGSGQVKWGYAPRERHCVRKKASEAAEKPLGEIRHCRAVSCEKVRCPTRSGDSVARVRKTAPVIIAAGPLSVCKGRGERYAAFFIPIFGKRSALCPTAKHTVSAARIGWSIPKEEVLLCRPQSKHPTRPLPSSAISSASRQRKRCCWN